MTNNQNHPLKQVRWGIPPILNYHGVLVTKTPKGYTVLNIDCEDEEGVDRIIEQAGKHLSKSILNDGLFTCTNDIK